MFKSTSVRHIRSAVVEVFKVQDKVSHKPRAEKKD